MASLESSLKNPDHPGASFNPHSLARPDRVATIIVLTGLALMLLVAAVGSFRNRLLHFMPDDCFY